MSESLYTVVEEYRYALDEYLAGAGERALERAYEFGRTAVGQGLGVLDIFKIHNEALAAALRTGAKPMGLQESVELSARFFIESLSPFEMIHRGFQETITALQQLNRTLEHQVSVRTEALSRSEQQYRLITEHARDLVSMIDLEGRILYASPSFKEVLGYTAEELIGGSCFSLIHPDDIAVARTIFQRAMFAPKGRAAEFRFLRKNGASSLFESVWNWVFDPSGEPRRVVIASRDISERKEAENLLKASEVRYRRLFESSREGIVLLDAVTGTITGVNPFFESLTGRSAAGLVGKRLWDLNLFRDAGKIEALWQRLGTEESVRLDDVVMDPLPGKTAEAELLCTLFLLGDQPVVQCNIHDSTARKRSERRRAAQYAVNRILADAVTPGDAMPGILEAMCRNLQWDAGILWGVDRYARVLRANASWCAPDIHLPDFEEWTKRSTFSPDAGLPGHVWISGEALWVSDLQEGHAFPHLHLRPGTGFRGAFAAPIRLGGEILGVIECFTRRTMEPDDELLGTATMIGSHVGQFIKRHWALESLRESEEQYRTVAETASDVILTINEESTILFVNRAVGAIFGYEPHELLGQKITLLMPEVYRYMHHTSMRRSLTTGNEHFARQRIEMPGIHRDGREIPLEISFGESIKKGKHIFTGILRDSTDRKRAEEQVHQSEEQLRSLSARLQSVREEERTWIAREIHDEFGQALTGMKMYISWMGDKLTAGREKKTQDEAIGAVLERVHAMSQLIDTTIESVQRVATALRPGVLDDLGLLAAIDWQAAEFQNRTGIHCELTSEVDELEIDEKRSTAVFRIFQETLTNIARHANASNVIVLLKRSNGLLVLQVRDNGRGIEQSEILSTRSLGLLGMRERAALFGGEVVVSGVPQKGTTVTVQIPLAVPTESGSA